MSERILVTGGAGFIGSHLCELLLADGHRVVVIDDLSTGRLENIAHLKPQPQFQFVRETVDNALVLDRLTSESDIVMHLAAAVGVELIVRDPVRTIRTNINSTEAVLTAAHRYGCKVLLASTSEVYGKGVRVPFQEDDDRLMGPTTRNRWAYAESKAVDEFLGSGLPSGVRFTGRDHAVLQHRGPAADGPLRHGRAALCASCPVRAAAQRVR